KFAEKRKLEPKKISNEGMKLLENYTWFGNIRELENLVERLNVISQCDEIPAKLIAQQLGEPNNSAFDYENLPLNEAVDTFERKLIVNALGKANGIKHQAAKMLGVGTSALYYKLEKYGLL
ncbi:sigma-54-dependent Fis family transcriptional regulator, partial [bacterium]|nr:sigma-54-dependent Fis family transcriptional regulator [bacterium]